MSVMYYCDEGAWHDTFFAQHWGALDYYFCAPGPSLRELAKYATRGPGRVIVAMNTAMPKVIPDIWICGDDPRCYDRQNWFYPCMKFVRVRAMEEWALGYPIKQLPNTFFYTCQKNTPEMAKDILKFRSHNVSFVWNRNTFWSALHICFWLGARRLHFVGTDFGGVRDYHDDRVLSKSDRDHNKALYREEIPILKQIRELALYQRIELVSCTPGSPINEFMDYRPLEEAMRVSDSRWRALTDTEKSVVHTNRLIEMDEEGIEVHPEYRLCPMKPDAFILTKEDMHPQEDFHLDSNGNFHRFSVNNYGFYASIADGLKLESVFQIGIRAGYDTLAMLTARPELHVDGADADVRDAGGLVGATGWALNTLRAKFPKAHLDFRVGDSRKLKALHRRYDLGIVDGLHTYEGAANDIALLSGYCNYILVHDYDSGPDVRRAVDEFLYKTGFEFQYVPATVGMLLIKIGLGHVHECIPFGDWKALPPPEGTGTNIPAPAAGVSETVIAAPAKVTTIPAPALSVVTTCQNRLANLKRVMPTWLAQEGLTFEIIVVDWGCSEGTAAWVQGLNDPRVRVVSSGPQPKFLLSAARNLGLKDAKATKVLFLDSDIEFTRKDAFFAAERVTCPRTLGIFTTDGRICSSVCIDRQALVENLGGWDEDYVLGCGEEADMVWRANLSGIYIVYLGDAYHVPHPSNHGKGYVGFTEQERDALYRENMAKALDTKLGKRPVKANEKNAKSDPGKAASTPAQAKAEPKLEIVRHEHPVQPASPGVEVQAQGIVSFVSNNSGQFHAWWLAAVRDATDLPIAVGYLPDMPQAEVQAFEAEGVKTFPVEAVAKKMAYWFRKPQVLLRAPFSRFLYLDIDAKLLVDPVDLLNEKRYDFGVVPDNFAPIRMAKENQKYTGTARNFCSGVILSNHTHPILVAWEAFTKANWQKYRGDQDTLSETLASLCTAFTELGQEWNCRPWQKEIVAKVLHYVGSWKNQIVRTEDQVREVGS